MWFNWKCSYEWKQQSAFTVQVHVQMFAQATSAKKIIKFGKTDYLEHFSSCDILHKTHRFLSYKQLEENLILMKIWYCGN